MHPDLAIAHGCFVYRRCELFQPLQPGGASEEVTRAVLLGIVSHAQKLFDVRRATGLYARLNDVYTRLGEMKNVMNTLKDLLALGTWQLGCCVQDLTHYPTALKLKLAWPWFLSSARRRGGLIMMDFLISSLHSCRLCAMACVSAKD